MTEGERNRRAEPTESRGGGGGLRRWGPFYVIGGVVLAALIVVPMVGGGDDDDDGNGNGTNGAATTTSGAPTGEAWAPASGDVEVGSGTTRGGVACEPGVQQIPDTIYAAPCVSEFIGDNGGETSRGVTADTIRIVRRTFPPSANQQALDEQLKAAGLATDAEAWEMGKIFLDYMNENYELYGREVEVIDYESEFGNSTTEVLGQGREGACQDATKIVEELHAFAVIDASQVFSECAAERELMVLNGGLYSSEDWYQEVHPYIWNLSMSCTVISDHVAEYLGKRLSLADEAAKYAGGELQGKPRKFGTYIPDNEQYLGCNDRTLQLLSDKWGIEDADSNRVTYQLDLARFAEQAQRAVLQFKADGVTTIVLAADPLSIGFMTAAAREQEYFPEWITIGTALADTDNFGRSYDQEQVEGRLFGVSQLPQDEFMFGPDGEAGVLYEKLTGETIPGGTTGFLGTLTWVFNFFQAAGPELTPGNIATGVQSLPVTGDENLGVFSFEGDHTAREDAKEVYWDVDAEPSPAEPDRTKRGRWVPTDDGRRYLREEWPEDPPYVYPDEADATDS